MKLTSRTDQFLDPDPTTKRIGMDLYEGISHLPIISPHSHVDACLFSTVENQFGTPVDLLIHPDHYVFRMLYSQGIPMEELGIQRVDNRPVETDHRKVWQLFADHYYLFRGTATGVWLDLELREVFGVNEKLSSDTAQGIYDQISTMLSDPMYQPRALYDQFNIEVLCTTDDVLSDLGHHQKIQNSGWKGNVRPTFRPDSVLDLTNVDWLRNVEALSETCDIQIGSFSTFIQALEQRRAFFKQVGALATDHGAPSPYTTVLSEREVETIFQRALHHQVSAEDARLFMAHMLVEMARMSCEDGLVMQVHAGAFRDHNPSIYSIFGKDKGADFPVPMEFTINLKPLLNNFGNHPNFNLIIFSMDEACYSRELAPLASHYPALKLGPPWWFLDGFNGIRRFLDNVVEIAGIYNTAGFNDDTRAFPSIAVRHKLWRKACVNWLAGLVVHHFIDYSDAEEMATDLAYRLAKLAYKIP